MVKSRWCVEEKGRVIVQGAEDGAVVMRDRGQRTWIPQEVVKGSIKEWQLLCGVGLKAPCRLDRWKNDLM